MRKLQLIAKHEYLKMVRRRSFLLGTLGIPLLIGAVMAISILVATGNEDARPLGYVDQAGVVQAQVARAAGEQGMGIEPFAGQEEARSALEAGAIQAYYVLPAGYRQSGRVQLFYLENAPNDDAQGRFNAFLRSNLLAGQEESVRQRLAGGVQLTLRSVDSRRQFSERDILGVLIPFVAGMFFVFAVLTSAGYLLQTVTAEKENRTVELMATSLSPFQLIGGKALGLMAVALTQLTIWALALALALFIGAQFWDVLRGFEMPWSLLLVAVLYFIPSYALVAGMMTAIGSAVTEMQQGQQIAGILNMFFVLPFFFSVLFFTDPNNPLLVALTLFPTTAFITVVMRWGVTVMPLWQLVVSWLLVVAAAGGMVWVASRIFRAGMLRYGQQLNWREITAALRLQGSQPGLQTGPGQPDDVG